MRTFRYTTVIFSLLTTKVNSKGKGVVLTFKSWAHIKSHMKCPSHVGSVESAAIIGHADSSRSTSPCGDHVSMYVAILPMDDSYCWVQHFVYVFKMKICSISNDKHSYFLIPLHALCVELQQPGFSGLCLRMPLVLFLIISHIIPPHPSHGCLYRASVPWAGVFQVSCFWNMKEQMPATPLKHIRRSAPWMEASGAFYTKKNVQNQ